MRLRRKKNLDSLLSEAGDAVIDKEIREKNSSVPVRDYIDFNALFGRSAPVWLDVGCGKGVFSVELAKRHKEAVLVAVERIGNVMVEGALRAVRENISKEPIMTLLDRLKENSDEKLKIFNARLTPSVASERILGVRSPVVKALAKEFYGSMEASLFLSQTPHFYLEENNLHGCLLCNIKDLDAAIAMTEEFLPFIDNWATNDITATGMKIFSRNTSAVRGFVERWLKSDKAYTVRFGIVCLLSYFLGEAFEESDLNLLASLNVKNEYYVDMAAAWYISVALVKKYDVAVKTLENGIFDVWVHNKAISKALESFRIDLDKKNYLRTLKR